MFDLKALTLLLLVYIVIRECFFAYTVNKLLNKAMSRSYHEYAVAESLLDKSRKNNALTKKGYVSQEEQNLDHVQDEVGRAVMSAFTS